MEFSAPNRTSMSHASSKIQGSSKMGERKKAKSQTWQVTDMKLFSMIQQGSCNSGGGDSIHTQDFQKVVSDKLPAWRWKVAMKSLPWKLKNARWESIHFLQGCNSQEAIQTLPDGPKHIQTYLSRLGGFNKTEQMNFKGKWEKEKNYRKGNEDQNTYTYMKLSIK